jgi:hypothetical protein
MANGDVQRSAQDIEQRADVIRATVDAVLLITSDLPDGDAKSALTAKVEGIATNAAHIGDSARLIAAANARR